MKFLRIRDLLIEFGDLTSEPTLPDPTSYETGYKDGMKAGEANAADEISGCNEHYKEGFEDGRNAEIKSYDPLLAECLKREEQIRNQKEAAFDALQICRDACNGLAGQVEAREARIKELEDLTAELTERIHKYTERPQT